MVFRFSRRQLQLGVKLAKPMKRLNCDLELTAFMNSLGISGGDESRIPSAVLQNFQAAIDHEANGPKRHVAHVNNLLLRYAKLKTRDGFR